MSPLELSKNLAPAPVDGDRVGTCDGDDGDDAVVHELLRLVR